MRAQLIVLNLVGNLVRMVWMAACVAILWFLAAACFYQSPWLYVGYATVAASVLYCISASYDVAFAQMAKKYREDQASTGVTPDLSTKLRRRAMAAKMPVTINSRAYYAHAARNSR